MPPIFYSFLDSFINPINKHKFDRQKESKDTQEHGPWLHRTCNLVTETNKKCFLKACNFWNKGKGTLKTSNDDKTLCLTMTQFLYLLRLLLIIKCNIPPNFFNTPYSLFLLALYWISLILLVWNHSKYFTSGLVFW